MPVTADVSPLAVPKRVKLKLPRDGRRRFEGRLVGVEDGRIVLDVEGQRQHLEFADIDRARLVPDV